MHWLIHVSGLDDATGAWYLFWSGVGADWTRIGVIFTGVHLFRLHHRKLAEKEGLK